MPVTFEVSPVDVATEPLKTQPFKQAFERRLGGAVEACGGSAASLVEGPSEHAFLATVRLAFDRHYPLVLRPDDVWLLLAQGFGQHVRKKAGALRERFVDHQGQAEITIRRDDFVVGSPGNAWPEVFDAFSDQIAQVIGKKRDLVVADFSTTGPAERAASQVVLMDAMQSWFRYAVLTLCGIPRITLLGTPADWAKVRRRASYLSELGLEKWVAALDPVLDQLSRAAAGRADPGFWRSFFKAKDASGGEQITGWINTFFPYLVHEESGELLENEFARE